jgi:hypothetical protein
MEIIEKQIEKVKEVPCGWNNDCGHGYSHNTRYATRGLAGTGLGLGIAGTALGLLSLSRNGGLNLFGNSNNSTPENVNINTIGGSNTIPGTFSLWEKECADALLAQKNLYDYAILSQNQRYTDRENLNKELFGLYKSQIDADFGLYKSNRDSYDAVTAKQNADTFSLYKSQRDADDALAARISALETKLAVNDAVDPWRSKVLDMRISGVAANANAAVALEAERRCCADGKIVNYVNGNFYPISVADVTTGTTATIRSTYNPLCGCCNPCMGNQF